MNFVSIIIINVMRGHNGGKQTARKRAIRFIVLY